MSGAGLTARWLWAVAALALAAVAVTAAVRRYRRRARRRALLERLERVAIAAAHQVQVPDGMGGFIHLDHLLLTPRGLLVLDTRRVPGLIFGGDQMSEWTVMALGRRYTFENPQPALYDRIAAVKALVGEVPVEGLIVFSSVGRFAKGKPKGVAMLDELDAGLVSSAGLVEGEAPATVREVWAGLLAQLRPSPHEFTNL
ncbi:MAG TPA: nuclease-related domain-containing protein [Steroidobacteraceae bacterium]|nr:nuclease-related domain-containing protein [Steroidobacteraceae bacterium]